ncbi:hypothetical protein BPTFM16_01877 [Altererythrobacter insulae]|nr:hypothetical protein BPTFM16_01877 [Altererythrobacter insulae]
MTFLAAMDPQSGLLDEVEPGAYGSALAHIYAANAPFPHIVIDDFLPDQIARLFLAEFDFDDAAGGAQGRTFDRAQERAKKQISPENLSPQVRQIFYAFNSRPFLQVLEDITGITGLIPDPDFLGGGLHEIAPGGHLSVHADFNRHKRLNLERRINLLIYLNEGWQDAFGGQLEFWSPDMTLCEKSVVPVFNRAVIFNTTSTSYHGNPNPVAHPDGISRKSIALYYYTATWDASMRSHTTRFRARPRTADKADWGVATKELAKDLIPPIISRNLGKLKRQAD